MGIRCCSAIAFVYRKVGMTLNLLLTDDWNDLGEGSTGLQHVAYATPHFTSPPRPHRVYIVCVWVWVRACVCVCVCVCVTHLFSLPFCSSECLSVLERSVQTYVFRRVMALPGMLFFTHTHTHETNTHTHTHTHTDTHKHTHTNTHTHANKTNATLDFRSLSLLLNT